MSSEKLRCLLLLLLLDVTGRLSYFHTRSLSLISSSLSGISSVALRLDVEEDAKIEVRVSH
jgi:hypothetical protein